MDEISRPSGAFLPLILRQKWRDQKLESEASAAKLTAAQKQNEITLQPHPTSGSAQAAELADRTFTAQELEERIWKTTISIIEIQKQALRGEETYYEETYAHGNLFKGWDAFVDSKDVGNGNSSLPSSMGGASRRVPSDCRWFSSSCRGVSRNARPTLSMRNLPSIRSETNTPVPSGISREPDLPASSSSVQTSKKEQVGVPSGGAAKPEPHKINLVPSGAPPKAEGENADTTVAVPAATESFKRKEPGESTSKEVMELSEPPTKKAKTSADGKPDDDIQMEDVSAKKEKDQSGVEKEEMANETSMKSNTVVSMEDVPIPKKKETKNPAANKEGESDKEGAQKAESSFKDVPIPRKAQSEQKELVKSEDPINDDVAITQKEISPANLEEETSKRAGKKDDEPSSNKEDPFKRRITRKRKAADDS
jgi:hypothetical protein